MVWWDRCVYDYPASWSYLISKTYQEEKVTTDLHWEESKFKYKELRSYGILMWRCPVGNWKYGARAEERSGFRSYFYVGRWLMAMTSQLVFKKLNNFAFVFHILYSIN